MHPPAHISWASHRYTRGTPEPAPLLSWHGAQIWVYVSTIKITMICQLHINCDQSVKIDTCATLHKDRGYILLCLFSHVWSAKTRIHPNLNPMTDGAITRVVWGPVHLSDEAEERVDSTTFGFMHRYVVTAVSWCPTR